ncbi:helix-turn-helix domain-containing protein [Maridesulfovibrio sp.]|uniref:helix-turn-helix domain-containing protein n=1 Tax=Maridesulfovibrio sp. TaxID=2795000 RepID=UPI003BAC28D2
MVTVDVNTWKKLSKMQETLFPETEKQIVWDEYLIRHGIKLLVQNSPPVAKHLSFNFKIEKSPVEFLYCLSGTTTNILRDSSGKDIKLSTKPGCCTLSYLPNSTGISHIEPEEPLQAVGLQISLEIFQQLAQQTDCEIQKLTNGDAGKTFFMTSALPFPLQLTVKQIIDCQLEGTRKKVFLEYKAMELLYTQLGTLDSALNASKGISSFEHEAVQKAHAILIDDLVSPPSLQELAQTVGLTHTRLNKVFRSVYGNTVFNVLREIRLECARRMIEDGKFNIAEIAYECGFSNPSHFSRVFSSTYGTQPKKYQSEILAKQLFSSS